MWRHGVLFQGEGMEEGVCGSDKTRRVGLGWVGHLALVVLLVGVVGVEQREVVPVHVRELRLGCICVLGFS